MKELNSSNFWTFDLEIQEGINFPILVIVGFQKRDRPDLQNLNIDTFCRPPVTSAQCVIRTQKSPDAGILSNYDDDDYFQTYGQNKEAFKALTNDDILRPYVSDIYFRPAKVNAAGEATKDIVYYFYVFSIRYERNLEAAQPTKVEFEISEDVPAGIYGYALVSTNKLVSKSSDWQHVTLMYFKCTAFVSFLFSFLDNFVFFSKASF